MKRIKPLKESGILLLRENLGPEAQRLKHLGAKVFHVPLLRRKLLKVKISSPDKFDWIIFTSASGVQSFKKLQNVIPKSCKLGCVGTETAKELQRIFKRMPDFIPKQFTTEAFAKEFKAPKPARLLLIRSGNADSRMETILRRRGYQARRLSVYRVERAADPKKLMAALSLSSLTHIFFGARSQAEAWGAVVSKGASEWLVNKGVRFLAIGPEASKALQRLNLPHGQAQVHTFDGMIDLMVKEWKRRK